MARRVLTRALGFSALAAAVAACVPAQTLRVFTCGSCGLAELQIFDASGANVAPTGVVSASSTFPGGPPEFATSNLIDDVLNSSSTPTLMWVGASSQSLPAPDGDWVAIALPAPVCVASIAVWLRTDCCTDDNVGADVTLDTGGTIVFSGNVSTYEVVADVGSVWAAIMPSSTATATGSRGIHSVGKFSEPIA